MNNKNLIQELEQLKPELDLIKSEKLLINEYYKNNPRILISNTELITILKNSVDINNENSQKQIKNIYHKSDKIVSNNKYILWLQKFTSEIPRFGDKSFCYDSIDEYDQENVKDLKIFFTGIAKYCTKNNISAYQDEVSSYYKIKYNNLGYIIGFVKIFGIQFFCNRCKIVDDCIDFNDIINSYSNKVNKVKKLKK